MKQYLFKAVGIDLAGFDLAGFDLEKEVIAWISPYLDMERSAAVRKRVHSQAYHSMESRCKAVGIVGVQMKEQARIAAQAAVAKWREGSGADLGAAVE